MYKTNFIIGYTNKLSYFCGSRLTLRWLQVESCYGQQCAWLCNSVNVVPSVQCILCPFMHKNILLNKKMAIAIFLCWCVMVHSSFLWAFRDEVQVFLSKAIILINFSCPLSILMQICFSYIWVIIFNWISPYKTLVVKFGWWRADHHKISNLAIPLDCHKINYLSLLLLTSNNQLDQASHLFQFGVNWEKNIVDWEEPSKSDSDEIYVEI